MRTFQAQRERSFVCLIGHFPTTLTSNNIRNKLKNYGVVLLPVHRLRSNAFVDTIRAFATQDRIHYAPSAWRTPNLFLPANTATRAGLNSPNILRPCVSFARLGIYVIRFIPSSKLHALIAMASTVREPSKTRK